MLEDDLRQMMADETAGLRAAPDLVGRVMRSTRSKRTRRVRLTALAAAVTVAGAVAPAYMVLAPGGVAAPEAGPGAAVAVETPRPDVTGQAPPSPPAIDDTPEPDPSPPADLGDLGDGRAFGHVKVGYLPDGLRWSHWSLDRGDEYSTSWNHDGKADGFYCVQIYVYEGQAVQEVDARVRGYREAADGREVPIGGGTGYLVRQSVGEDGEKGTPSIFLSVGEGRRAEVMFSPAYAKEYDGDKTMENELVKIAEGLTADD